MGRKFQMTFFGFYKFCPKAYFDLTRMYKIDYQKNHACDPQS